MLLCFFIFVFNRDFREAGVGETVACDALEEHPFGTHPIAVVSIKSLINDHSLKRLGVLGYVPKAI